MAASPSLPADISTVIKSGTFAFDGEEFTAYNHPREDPKRLKEILFPEKSWYMSQLQHYGVSFKSKDTLAQLKERLEGAVKQGLCKKVPEDHKTLEEELRATYNARILTTNSSGKKGTKAGPLSLKAATANPNPSIKGRSAISETASKSSTSKTSVGTPARASKGASASQASSLSKATSKAIAATKSPGPKNNQISKVQKPTPKPKAKAIVASKSAEPSGSERESSLRPPKSESPRDYPPQTARKGFNIFQSTGRNYARKSSAVLQNIQRPVRDPKKFTPKGNIFLDAIGEYEIECPAISEGWDLPTIGSSNDELMLTIIEPGSGSQEEGWFDFGIMEGVMRFRSDPAFIEQCDFLRYQGHASDEMEWEGGESSSGIMQRGSSNNGSKRRLYFQWRGRDSDYFGGQIHFANNHQGGYLEFDDEVCSSFTGYGSFPSLGSKFSFRGYKLYDDPDGAFPSQGWGMGWNSYSERAYEEANRARWGR